MYFSRKQTFWRATSLTALSQATSLNKTNKMAKRYSGNAKSIYNSLIVFLVNRRRDSKISRTDVYFLSKISQYVCIAITKPISEKVSQEW